jgi:CRP/FNR family transcriptional regulator, cyclic AMP receptor protein
MTGEDSGLAEIADSHLFKSLSTEGRERLWVGATTVEIEEGQIVVREGEPGEALFIVKSGQVRVHTVQAGGEVVLATLGRGACFGEVALLTKQPRTATVVAMENCRLLRFNRKEIEEVLDAYPKVKKLLQAIVVGRAKDTIEKLSRN